MAPQRGWGLGSGVVSPRHRRIEPGYFGRQLRAGLFCCYQIKMFLYCFLEVSPGLDTDASFTNQGNLTCRRRCGGTRNMMRVSSREETTINCGSTGGMEFDSVITQRPLLGCCFQTTSAYTRSAPEAPRCWKPLTHLQKACRLFKDP